MGRVLRGMGLVVLVAVLTACGHEAVGGSPAEGPATKDTPSEGHHTGAARMNMGNPNATPADKVPGAQLSSGSFQLLDTAPQGYQNVSGTATLARHGGGTTVTVEFRGLKPGTQFVSHVHQGSCADSGGEHYKFDPSGDDWPPNEIHLVFTSTPEGTGYMTAENDQTAGPQVQSVVVHPREGTHNPIACAPLS